MVEYDWTITPIASSRRRRGSYVRFDWKIHPITVIGTITPPKKQLFFTLTFQLENDIF
jgi:hypothetical protein